MTTSTATTNPWIPLGKLGAQLKSNLAALATRDPELAGQLAAWTPSADYFIRTQGDIVELGRRAVGGADIETLANPLPPAGARDIAAKIFPDAKYSQPLLITGLDQGWLWDAIYKLPCICATAPGMRFPLYLLAGQVERLWVVLHYQNWRGLLTDARVRIVAGADAVIRMQEILAAEPALCVPRMTVTVEPQLWTEGRNLDAMLQGVAASVGARLAEVQRQLAAGDSGRTQNISGPNISGPNISGTNFSGPLRIMGITSRYTTFLQHSMRDWLAAMEKMGHTTRLVIEKADHELVPPTVMGEECLAFRPDLIVIIDHYRGEMAGLPRHVPCVMWVQDRLPNIFTMGAGMQQESRDYVIGYGRQECTRRWGYPAVRFMPSMVGVNEDRFAQRELSGSELAEYGCDAAFVSHASVPADQIVQEEIRRAGDDNTRRLLGGVYDRLRGIYDGGNSITSASDLTGLIEAAFDDAKVMGDSHAVLDLVSQRINNALLRHQAIRWVAETGVDLRLYGRGWENHPEFSKFARGIADNQNQLSLIYQASRVNLQVTPFGSAHQRLFEGLACGGFFLLRAVTGEAIDLLNREAWRWCRRAGINDAREMTMIGGRSATFQWILSGLKALGENPAADPEWFYAGLEEAALAGFSRCASTLWGEYPQVSFWTKQELTEKLTHFLGAAEERAALSASMRQGVLRWHTYAAISKRMFALLAADQQGGRLPRAKAA